MWISGNIRNWKYHIVFISKVPDQKVKMSINGIYAEDSEGVNIKLMFSYTYILIMLIWTQCNICTNLA